ncbi:hypothetical protein QBC37DRAFT_423055 [Rhypophila decipiens]|uniref:Rhodopsin domain-containing protein n=1 Tax=Rhypophila decipiens TaxID=261697 RepID=A0AAN6Y672_9PEZI|nr:hypothetical protein QBC37DRAFT_423055 [Rhypophila decipiens]
MSGTALSAEDIAKLPHDDRGPAILVSHWILTAAATLFLGLRVYCKRSTSRQLWWDDWILIASWLTIIATDILTTILVFEFKLGKHSWDLEVSPVNFAKFIILLSARASFTLTALGWTKTAFAITLLRLTEGITRTFVWFIIISLNVTTIISGLVPWIQCSPLEKTWDPMTREGQCWAPKVGTKIWIGMGAYSALMDFTLAILPWTFLYHLSLRKKEKLGILVAMSMGVIAGGVAIAKCAKLPQLGSGDSYNEVELYIWDITESSVTMMAACIPTLRVLLQAKTKSDLRGSGSGTTSGDTSQTYSLSPVSRPRFPPSAHIRSETDYDQRAAGFMLTSTYESSSSKATPVFNTMARTRKFSRHGNGNDEEQQEHMDNYFDLHPSPQRTGSSEPVLAGMRTRYEYPSN